MERIVRKAERVMSKINSQITAEKMRLRQLSVGYDDGYNEPNLYLPKHLKNVEYLPPVKKAARKAAAADGVEVSPILRSRAEGRSLVGTRAKQGGVEGERKVDEHFLYIDSGAHSSSMEEIKKKLDERVEQGKWQSVQHFANGAGSGPHSFTVSQNLHPSLPLAKNSHLIPITQGGAAGLSKVAQRGGAAGRLQRRVNSAPAFTDDATQRRLRAADAQREKEVHENDAEEHARQQHELDTYMHVNSKLTQGEEAQYNRAMEGAFKVWRDNMGTPTQMHAAPPTQDEIPPRAPKLEEMNAPAPPKEVKSVPHDDKAPEAEPEAVHEPETPSNFTPVKIDVPVFSALPKGLNLLQKK